MKLCNSFHSTHIPIPLNMRICNFIHTFVQHQSYFFLQETNMQIFIHKCIISSHWCHTDDANYAILSTFVSLECAHWKTIGIFLDKNILQIAYTCFIKRNHHAQGHGQLHSYFLKGYFYKNTWLLNCLCAGWKSQIIGASCLANFWIDRSGDLGAAWVAYTLGSSKFTKFSHESACLPGHFPKENSSNW